MRRFVPILMALSIHATRSEAQSNGEIYVRSNTAITDKILAKYNGSCGSPSARAGRFAKLVIVQRIGEAYEVAVAANDDAPEMAVRDSLYCISPDNLTAYFRLERGLETGTLAVPFKIRLNPTELVAGGAVGGYAGNRFRERNGSYGVGLVFASLTSVAVNDTSKNAEVPHSPLGVAVGVGLVYAVAREFQLGLILGYDLFQKPEGTNYKNKPWLSFSVGYAFLNSKTDTATAARALSGR